MRKIAGLDPKWFGGARRAQRARSRTVAVACAATAFSVAAFKLRPGRSLSGKVVLITGGSRGLGFLLAREFARQGCKVAICARDPDALDRAREQFSGISPAVFAVRCDVSKRAEVDTMIADVQTHFGSIDVLVNNASVLQVGPLEAMAMEDFEQAMAANYWGTVIPTLAVLPGMRNRRAGHIVNITSIGGRVAVPHLLPYDAAKFASVGFSQGLRAELLKQGICVTTVVPGLMRTGSPVHVEFKGEPEREFGWFSAGDELPLISMDARKAARRIVRATRRQDAYVTLGWQAKVLQLVHDLMPSFTTRVLGDVNRLLPSTTEAGTPREGKQLVATLPGALRRALERAMSDANQG
jgi:NAD(P)-dependent dehydrogenase (short-subunit alcohol dehydrogenase family)